MFFIYHKSTCVTGKAIAKALGFRSFGKRPVRNVNQDFPVLLRWGSSYPLNAATEINPWQAITLAAHKYNALKAMKDAGVSTIAFSKNAADIWNAGYEEVYCRANYGSKGKDIKIIPRGNHLHHADLFTGFVEAHREYRIHVVNERVIRVQGKYLDYPEQDKNNGRIRNHANGYRFKTPQKKLKPEREQDAILAVKALGLDFGAVDMILGKDNQHYILEVNTGPACSPMTAQVYCAALAELIAERTDGGWRPEVNPAAFYALRADDDAPIYAGV